MTLLAWGLLGLFWLLLAGAAISDLRSLSISNTIVLATLGAATALWLVRPEAGAWWQHLAAFAIMLGIGFALFSASWMGGADAKLAAAAAIAFDLQELVWFAVATALAGGVLTLLLLLIRRVMPGHQRRWLGLTAGKSVPYGVAIAAGAAIVSAGLVVS